ncbi:MAG: alpha/beta hydrolase [Rhodospirillaceae bacterium]|nr:alpha/beta hydrolase [Rhodospirillaceae bacterium]
MRALKWTAIVLAAVFALAVGGVWQQQIARHADASPIALAALVSDDTVRVDERPYLTFRPRQSDERLGVVVYPGAYVDVRGYVPTLRRIAAAGYRVVVAPMPFELAILAVDRAKDVIAANPDVAHWAILGHSVGGAAAATFAHRHPDAVAGVIIWDSYPPSTASLADFAKPVWHVHRARPNGAPPENLARQRDVFPPDSQWRPIPGGIHMNFGSFTGGGYREDWPPAISQNAQHDLVVAATLEALADIERHAWLPPRK